MRWSGYILGIFQATVQALANELSGLHPEINEHLIWINVGITFDKLFDVLQQKLACWLEESIDRPFDELVKVSSMLGDMFDEIHGKI